ncbi:MULTISPECIES: acyl carrier protein [Actinoalloteichus]|uniref:acyl carrier protein n=1 Tax=Actinoalloteichus TaxID=65496 RepID=UPI00268F83EA|nr:CgpO [Actinoalloteichus caeruleus]
MIENEKERLSTAEITSTVRVFFSTAGVDRAIEADEDYFSLGYLNSLLALELVTYVERSFGITVEVEDLDLDNFRTIARVVGFVRRKLDPTSGTADGVTERQSSE